MEICSYGCNNESKFFFKNGKGCCSTSPNKCPGKRNKYNDEINKYYPDFIIDGIYYEIKGRRCYDDLDNKTKCKIDQFNDKLVVLYEKDINKYLKYTISNYGKNFTELYE
jgi:hypothetical protein